VTYVHVAERIGRVINWLCAVRRLFAIEDGSGSSAVGAMWRLRNTGFLKLRTADLVFFRRSRSAESEPWISSSVLGVVVTLELLDVQPATGHASVLVSSSRTDLRQFMYVLKNSCFEC
jgi:hypothetical protein